MTPFDLTAPQRLDLHEDILIHLAGMGDVWIEAAVGSPLRARGLQREYTEELLFLLHDLQGALEGPPDRQPIKVPSLVLREVLSRVRVRAETRDRAETSARDRVRVLEEQNERVRSTCTQLLAELGER